MTFFNKKEEVINIELTPYGRSLLAKGKLKPAYYAFFDDDILYDVMAAGASTPEPQNAIETRIFNETPRTKATRDLQSPEGLIFRYERTQENHRPHTQLKLNYLTDPLGTSEQTSDYGPAWNSLFIQGEITGSVQTTLTGSIRIGNATVIPPLDRPATKKIGSDQYLKQIPQINANIEYTMQIKNSADLPPVSGQQVAPRAPVSKIFPDGTYLDIIQEQIICRLKEDEGFLFKDGLEMEVYLYEDTPEENLLPLKFRPQSHQIKNGILLDEPVESYVELDPTYVGYWMNFNLDSEIPDEDICAGIQKLKSQDIELEFEIDCPDNDAVDFDIYGTRITEVEKCD